MTLQTCTCLRSDESYEIVANIQRMPGEKKRKSTTALKNVKITVEDDFTVPSFYATASPVEVGTALIEGAALQIGNPALIRTKVEAAVNEAKQMYLLEREVDITERTDQLTTILQEHREQMCDLRNHMEAQRVQMEEQMSKQLHSVQKDCEEAKQRAFAMEAQNEALQERISALVKENDELNEKEVLEVAQDDKFASVRQHFTDHGRHSTELCKLYQKHHELIKQLDRSMVEIRAKEYVFYKESKRINQSEGLHADMNLSFETSADFVLGKMLEGKAWNDIKHSAREDIEREFNKESFMMIVKQNKGPPEENVE